MPAMRNALMINVVIHVKFEIISCQYGVSSGMTNNDKKLAFKQTATKLTLANAVKIISQVLEYLDKFLLVIFFDVGWDMDVCSTLGISRPQYRQTIASRWIFSAQ